MAPPHDEEARYERVLREFEAFTRETQAYRARTEQALDEMKTSLTTYWAATAAGMRQLSDWFAETEREARIERTEERIKRDRREKWIISLLVVVLVAVGILVYMLG